MKTLIRASEIIGNERRIAAETSEEQKAIVMRHLQTIDETADVLERVLNEITHSKHYAYDKDFFDFAYAIYNGVTKAIHNASKQYNLTV